MGRGTNARRRRRLAPPPPQKYGFSALVIFFFKRGAGRANRACAAPPLKHGPPTRHPPASQLQNAVTRMQDGFRKTVAAKVGAWGGGGGGAWGARARACGMGGRIALGCPRRASRYRFMHIGRH